MPRRGKLGTYLAETCPGQNTERDLTRPRPPGELVWYHATSHTHADAAIHLADRLAQTRPDIYILLTADQQLLQAAKQHDNVIHHLPPADTAAASNAFLTHWNPDICVWTAGNLKPTLLGLAQRSGTSLYLVDADETQITRASWRWLPDTSRTTLKRFALIMARTAETEAYLRRRLGLREARIIVTGELREESKPLPYSETDHTELTALLRGRPIWLVARLRADELGTVLEANNTVTRMSHRTLLILVPDSPGDIASFHAGLSERGLRYITWSEGTLPDETTQAILADIDGELGLWYRISPITFMGGTLSAGGHGSDPNEPAAHGSAILYGPNIRTYLNTYSRFAEAGAARIVRDAATLAAAVQRIIPPDQSAAMAHAAWDVATQSAVVMDRIAETILGALDNRKAS